MEIETMFNKLGRRKEIKEIKHQLEKKTQQKQSV